MMSNSSCVPFVLSMLISTIKAGKEEYSRSLIANGEKASKVRLEERIFLSEYVFFTYGKRLQIFFLVKLLRVRCVPGPGSNDQPCQGHECVIKHGIINISLLRDRGSHHEKYKHLVWLLTVFRLRAMALYHPFSNPHPTPADLRGSSCPHRFENGAARAVWT